MNNKIFFVSLLSGFALNLCECSSSFAILEQEDTTMQADKQTDSKKEKITKTAIEMVRAITDYIHVDKKNSSEDLWETLETTLERLVADCGKNNNAPGQNNTVMQIPEGNDFNEEDQNTLNNSIVSLQFEKDGLEEYKKQVANLTKLLRSNTFIREIIIEIYENPTAEDLLIISALIGYIGKFVGRENVQVVLKIKQTEKIA